MTWRAHLRADPLPWLLAELGHGRDPRLARVLSWLEAAQDDQGRWANRHAYNGKTWVDIERQGQPSKWVTLRACTVLRAAYGDSGWSGRTHPGDSGEERDA